MLHLVFQSPVEAAILQRIDVGDDVVFLENAVLRVLQQGNLNNALTELLKSARLYVISDDMAVRGILPDELVKGLEVIDYAGLVTLTVNNPVIQSWF